MEKQMDLIRQGIKYGLVFALLGALLCLLVMLPVALLYGPSSGDGPDSVSMPALIFVSTVVPVAALGILGAALYKLVPLYVQYRRARQSYEEELFP